MFTNLIDVLWVYFLYRTIYSNHHKKTVLLSDVIRHYDNVIDCNLYIVTSIYRNNKNGTFTRTHR